MLGAGAASCSSGDGSGRANALPEEMFTRTIVQLHPDGTQTVKVLNVTRAEQEAEWKRLHELAQPKFPQAGGENIGSTTEAISQDTSCVGTSNWLWDVLNNVGPGNEICFAGTGTADLSTYCRVQVCNPFCGCRSYWDGHVKSYWTGQYPGHFTYTGPTNGSCTHGCQTSFLVDERVDNADSCVNCSDQLFQSLN